MHHASLLKCCAILIAYGFLGLFLLPAAYASPSQEIISINRKNISLDQLLWEIQKETDFVFAYSTEDLEGIAPMDYNLEGELHVVLTKILKDTDLVFEKSNNVYIIKKATRPKSQPVQEDIYVSGTVTDELGLPIPGVNVSVKNKTHGTVTSLEGIYQLRTSMYDTLVFSFLGMKTHTEPIRGRNSIDVSLQTDTQALEDVVIEGFVRREKEYYTGAATTLKGEEIRQISTNNIFQAIAVLDPSVVVQENNLQGSNPNVIPEFIIRGTTSLNAENEFGVNSPLIVIDGVESTLRALYDMDLFEIESVTILKDASATALYGEQASNGVILIQRKQDIHTELRLTYNFVGDYQYPDLSDYNLMNAAQKLEMERQAGLYDDPTGAQDLIYNQRLALVNSGVDTDWMAKPVRNSFSHTHSLAVSGRGSGMEYRVTGRYKDTQGVMKDDYRKNYGVGIFLSYNLAHKLVTTLRLDYDQNNYSPSRYGSFQDFTRLNPYDAPYDEHGVLRPILSYNLVNPLYEASLASFAENKLSTLTANLNLRYNIKPGFFATLQGNITSDNSRSDTYVSPLSGEYSLVTNPSDKGRYTISSNDFYSFYLRPTLNFTTSFDQDGSALTLNAGGEIRGEKADPYGFTATGFFSDKLNDVGFASRFQEGSAPVGEATESTGLAGFVAGNINYKSRYFLDGSARISGNSRFGTHTRWAPFYSAGAGWNLHNEAFLDHDWIEVLRLRASFGQTGSINFPAFQAITTYRYAEAFIWKYGNGANPITLGNEDLKWETTQQFNLGLNSTFFGNKLNFNFDIYKNRTTDMIVPINVPYSTGVSVVPTNLGEQLNQGFEALISAMVFQNDQMYWRVGGGIQRNETELINIGNALRELNAVNAAAEGVAPARLLIEGESPTQIYTVRSAGIDPATGQELYIDKNNMLTYDWDPTDKVAVGDQTPDYRGSLNSTLTYKNWSLSAAAFYSVGGYIYNTTKVERIEAIDPRFNSDVRAFTDRWEKPGDVVNYLSRIGFDQVNTRHSSRFVEKENYLEISTINLLYTFDQDFVDALGFRALHAGIYATSPFRFSTVDQERGLEYPFARGFSFNLTASF